MRRMWVFAWMSLVAALVLLAWSTTLADERLAVKARLSGYRESPSVSSTGGGAFRARLEEASLEFELSYSGLEGSVTQAHIHLGQRGVNGGVMIFLCSNLTGAPLGTPPCPQDGSVSGVRTASDVIGPAGQGIAAGEFAEALRAIRSGNTYVNVHSTKHPGGEIRGQVRTDSQENDE